MFVAKDDYFKSIFQKTAESESDSDEELGEPSVSSSQPEDASQVESNQHDEQQSEIEQVIKGECSKNGSNASPCRQVEPDLKELDLQPDCINIDTDCDSGSSSLVNLDPSKPQEIIISDDDEDCIHLDHQPIQSQAEISVASINSSLALAELRRENPDLEDYEYNLKISFLGNIRMFPTKDQTRLRVVLAKLIEELEQQGKELMIMKENTRVSLDETPASLDLSPATILQAITINLTQPAPVQNTDGVKVKLQDGHRKHTKEFVIELNAPMSDLKKKYLKSFNLDVNTKLRLDFDGETVDDEATAEELDIDDGCVIDVMFC